MPLRYLLLLLAWQSAAAFAQLPPVPLPASRNGLVVVAHRGDHTLHPENTLEAVEAAIASRADYVEVDLRTSKDGRLLLCHDERVDRTTDGRGLVRELTWDSLSRLSVRGREGGRYRIPELQEVLKRCKDRINIYLDFKDADPAAAFSAIREAGMERQVVLYLGSIRHYVAWRKIAPAIPLMTSLPSSIKAPADLAAVLDRMTIEVVDNARDTALLNYAWSRGMHVWLDVQGMDEGPAKWDAALALGVQGLQTDRPAALISHLEKRGLRNGSGVRPVAAVKSKDPGFRKLADVAYAKRSPEQVMDVYFPRDYRDAPVILYIHGGSWVSGDKGEFPQSLVEELVGRKGYLVASMNYRLIRDGSPRFPAQVEDVASAVRFLAKASRKYGFNGNSLAIMGGSAGGQLALLYAYAYDRRRRVNTVIDLWGPTDFTDSSVRRPGTDAARISENYLGDRDPRSAVSYAASPLHRVDARTAKPTLIVHGGADPLVPVSQAENLHRRLQALGATVRYEMYPDERHGIGASVRAEVFGKVVDWISEYLPHSRK